MIFSPCKKNNAPASTHVYAHFLATPITILAATYPVPDPNVHVLLFTHPFLTILQNAIGVGETPNLFIRMRVQQSGISSFFAALTDLNHNPYSTVGTPGDAWISSGRGQSYVFNETIELTMINASFWITATNAGSLDLQVIGYTWSVIGP